MCNPDLIPWLVLVMIAWGWTKTYHILTRYNFAPNIQHLIYYSKYLWRTGPMYTFTYSFVSCSVPVWGEENHKDYCYFNYSPKESRKNIFFNVSSIKGGKCCAITGKKILSPTARNISDIKPIQPSINNISSIQMTFSSTNILSFS